MLSKKSRVVNNWKVISATAYGEDYTASYPIKEIDITKDGKFKELIYNDGQLNYFTRAWVFNDDKTELIVTIGNSTNILEILKLEKDEMKIRHKSPNSELTLELVTK